MDDIRKGDMILLDNNRSFLVVRIKREKFFGTPTFGLVVDLMNMNSPSLSVVTTKVTRTEALSSWMDWQGFRSLWYEVLRDQPGRGCLDLSEDLS